LIYNSGKPKVLNLKGRKEDPQRTQRILISDDGSRCFLEAGEFYSIAPVALGRVEG
jgi:hypothetical protein